VLPNIKGRLGHKLDKVLVQQHLTVPASRLHIAVSTGSLEIKDLKVLAIIKQILHDKHIHVHRSAQGSILITNSVKSKDLGQNSGSLRNVEKNKIMK